MSVAVEVNIAPMEAAARAITTALTEFVIIAAHKHPHGKVQDHYLIGAAAVDLGVPATLSPTRTPTLFIPAAMTRTNSLSSWKVYC